MTAQRDTSWQARAACAGVGPDLFFAAADGYWRDDSKAHAKAVCAICPVAGACLDYALAGPERHGIWGGLTPVERARIRRRRALDAREAVA